MPMILSTQVVRKRIKEFVKVAKQYFDKDAPRESVIEWMDERCDDIWGELVKPGRIDQYDIDDLIDTATECGIILKVAREDAWIEDDTGLWEGLTYGVVASQTYFSLRNLLYNALKNAGHDTNDDLPFALVRDQYEDGKCPDCGKKIPLKAVIGGACANCGHVWNPVTTYPTPRKVMKQAVPPSEG